MDVTINNTKMIPPAEVVTWGDLLDWVETQHLKSGQCITRVMFRGEEEIHYRKNAVCDQGLLNLGPVHIESGEFDVVVRESFAELENEITLAIQSTGEIIRLLEARSEDKAYPQLALLLDAIRIFYSVFSEDLGWVQHPDTTTTRIQQTAVLDSALRQLIAAQENHFWVSICDVLEYEITPILETWRSTVERTRARVN